MLTYKTKVISKLDNVKLQFEDHISAIETFIQSISK